MKKNLYFILVAVVLLVVAVIYFKDKSGTLNIDSKAFSISDTAAISNITIQNNGIGLVFDRRGTTWLVNEKYKVKQRAIDALMSSLMNFEVMAPVSKNKSAQVLDNMRKRPIVITIRSYSKIVKKFYVTDGDSLHNGSYMMLDGQDKPFAVHMAGFEGRLSVFFTTDPFIWRDRVIFCYQPGEILFVEVSYPAHYTNSFVMNTSNGDHLQVKSMETNALKTVSKETAMHFLMNFAMVPFEWIYSAKIHAISDSLSRQKPYCEIRVKDTDNRINTLRTYRIPDPSRSGSFDPNKMYAIQQYDSIPLYVKFVDLDPILKTYQDFKTE